jgi:hypothetical protein
MSAAQTEALGVHGAEPHKANAVEHGAEGPASSFAMKEDVLGQQWRTLLADTTVGQFLQDRDRPPSKPEQSKDDNAEAFVSSLPSSRHVVTLSSTATVAHALQVPPPSASALLVRSSFFFSLTLTPTPTPDTGEAPDPVGARDGRHHPPFPVRTVPPS